MNYEGALATASAVVILLTPVVVLLARAFSRSLKDTIKHEVEGVVAREVTPRFIQINGSIKTLESITAVHAIQIARLEGVQEGKAAAATQAGLTSTRRPPPPPK